MAAQMGKHQMEVGERFRAEEDYQNWIRIKKLQKADQVREYKQILETQMQLSDIKKETDRRTVLGSLAPPAFPELNARPEGYSSPADPINSPVLNMAPSSPTVMFDQSP